MVKKPLCFLLVALLAGCGDMMNPAGPDASLPMVDAMPDAMEIDAPPPWDPPEPVLPDDPCVILDDLNVSTEHEAMYNRDMANYAIRFKDGQGLEASPDIRQSGLLEVENADLDRRDVVQKRFGADVLGNGRSSTPGDDIPAADKRAIWARYNEVILQTAERIYSRKQVTDEAAFQWRDVGAWTQMRLREAYAGAFADEALNADVARLGEATVVAYGLDAGAPNANTHLAVYGPTMTQEADSDFGSNGSRPRLSVLNSTSAMFTFQSHSGANPLSAYRVTLGDDPPPGFVTNPVAAMPVDGGVWDVHGAEIADSPFAPETVTAWLAAAPTATEATLVVRIENNQAGSPHTGTQAFAAAPSNLADVAVAVWPRQVSGTIRVVTLRAFDNAGTWTVNNSWIDFDAASGAVVGSVASSTAIDANEIHSLALSFVDRENAYVAVEQTDPAIPGTSADVDSRKVTYYTMARGAGLVATGTVHYATTLHTQGAIAAGTPTDTLVSAGADPLTPAFVEQLISISSSFDLDDNARARNGWVMFSPRTGEVLARSMVGYTGNYNTRIARPPKGSLISVGDNLTWGGAVSVLSEPTSEPLNAVATCRINREQLPNSPGQADGSVVSAHAGYPRAYDGANAPFEHDWHVLSRISLRDITVGAGTPFDAGTYQMAATWEWDDANGIRYRSPPWFRDFTTTNTFEAFDFEVESLTHTERENVNLVIWVSGANGATLHRIWTVPATNTARIQQLTVSESQIPNFAEYDTTNDAIEAQEQLDQGDAPLTQGVVPGERARVTDFLTRAGDRLWSRDPLAGKLARFSIPSREATGFSMHWPLAFALEHPEEQEVTGVLEMDGRLVMGSDLTLALLTSDGPDATGSGAFGLPTTLRGDIGFADQAQIARTPLGYVFGTRNGPPRLLTPGLTIEDLGKLVERVYKIDGGNIVAIAYDQNREEMILLADAGATLRLNTGTGRWGSDPNRLGRDLTVTLDGTVYLIRSDGEVLRQVQDAWADGATGYALAVSTPWIRDMTRDGTTHSNFRLNSIHVSGEYIAAHDLFFEVYKDFNDSTPWGTFQVQSADIVANNTANRGWIYGVRIGGRDSFYAARIVVRDGAEATQTFRLAQVDVDVETDKSSKYAELPRTHYAAKV